MFDGGDTGMNDILILSHAHDAVNPDSNYTINLMARLFAGSGLKVAYQKGLARQPQARAVINQVDLTTTPEAYIQYFKEFPVAINGRLTQISKAVVCQDTLVRLGDGYGGPVIVKTSLNCGGFPELAMMVETGSIEPGVRLRRTWRDLQVIDPLNYPIYASPDLVPEGVWENPRLVVQRLRTERDDQGLYCLRSWYVLGDRGFHVMTKSREPIVRGSGIIHREVLEVVTPPGDRKSVV